MAYIATGRKYVRLLWTLFVIAGFTGAGVLIYQSFQSWNESPVKTTIETHPIEDITFPKVTVCPPKNTFTDLNYDLMVTENMTLSEGIKDELINYSLELLYDHLHENMIKNLSLLEDKERYYNWYHGYTEILLPYYYASRFNCDVRTSAISGNISSQHYGQNFDLNKVPRNIKYTIKIKPPPSVRDTGVYYEYLDYYPDRIDETYSNDDNYKESNVTLHIKIAKISMKDLSGMDILVVDDRYYPGPEVKNTSYNITEFFGESFVPTKLERDVSLEDVKRQRLVQMPGFKVTWYYSGLKVGPETEYGIYPRTMAFVRNCSNNITIYPNISRCFCFN